jgi:hypothetical protein
MPPNIIIHNTIIYKKLIFTNTIIRKRKKYITIRRIKNLFGIIMPKVFTFTVVLLQKNEKRR